MLNIYAGRCYGLKETKFKYCCSHTSVCRAHTKQEIGFWLMLACFHESASRNCVGTSPSQDWQKCECNLLKQNLSDSWWNRVSPFCFSHIGLWAGHPARFHPYNHSCPGGDKGKWECRQTQMFLRYATDTDISQIHSKASVTPFYCNAILIFIQTFRNALCGTLWDKRMSERVSRHRWLVLHRVIPVPR